MKNFLIIIFVLILVVSQNTTFWASWETNIVVSTWVIHIDSNKTIKELNAEVKKLNSEKKSTNIKIVKAKNKLNIQNFIKEELSEKEKYEVKELLYLYNAYKDQLNKKLESKSKELKETSQIKNNIISNKKEIYNKLVPYIKKEKFNEYLDFIQIDLEVEIEKNEIIDSTIKKTTILNKKVENIKEKIIEHNKQLEEKLKIIISEKVDEKIKNFTSSSKYKLLDSNWKESVIKKLIYKTNFQVEELKSIEDKTSLLERKINIFEIIQEKLEKLLLETN